MQDAMTVYFNGEKHAGLILAGIAVSIIVVAALLVRGGAGLRSLAITLGLLAVVELAIGLGLYLRTGPQVRRLAEQLHVDETAFHSAERARMARVQRNFLVIEYAEIAVIIAAVLVVVLMKERSTAVGVALGLLVHASLLLTFDVLAERRGAVYLAMVDDDDRER